MRIHTVLAGLLAVLPLAAAVPPGGLMCELMEYPARTSITNPHPAFTWVVNSSPQTAYRITVGTAPALADMWDTGKVASPASLNIVYQGKPLKPGARYHWRVQAWDKGAKPSAFSAAQEFRFAAKPDSWNDRYPLLFSAAPPARLVEKGPGHYFVDFGKDAYAYASLQLSGNFSGKQLEVRFGERADGDAVHTKPGASIRYGISTVPLGDGAKTYELRPPSISGKNIRLPDSIGVVLPFRYVEIVGSPAPIAAAALRQQRLHYQFNSNAASFHSSSPVLNDVWELCRYSMEATSALGVYIDGDRERLPYEADAYINQLSHYAVDREYTLARYSHEFLLANPTWPTEWKFHSILVAWMDYLYTGNKRSIETHYDVLKSKLFLDRVRADGLLHGFTKHPAPRGSSADIVDWPMSERDAYVMTEYNTVVNAFYIRSLQLMAEMAAAVGKTQDAAQFRALAARALEAFNRVFWDASKLCYVDGEGVSHASSHANFFPLSFGLVPEDRKAAVARFVKSRDMAPSVYGAQFLLEALYLAGEEDFALTLMTTKAERGWWNMLAQGSTITLEAWSAKFKPNLDWNHAWGAAPGNVITRYVLGLKALEPGFGKVEIRPQPGSLELAEGVIPTVRGPVAIRVEGKAGARRLTVTLPGNMTAQVILGKTAGTAGPGKSAWVEN